MVEISTKKNETKENVIAEKNRMAMVTGISLRNSVIENWKYISGHGLDAMNMP